MLQAMARDRLGWGFFNPRALTQASVLGRDDDAYQSREARPAGSRCLSVQRFSPSCMRASAADPWRVRRISPGKSEGHGDGLGLKIVLESLGTILATPAGLLVTAERQDGIEHMMTVEPDGARLDALGHLVRDAGVLRPDARGQAVLGVIGLSGQFVELG